MDTLLNTTSQVKLSERSPIPAKGTDAHTDTQAPVSDQSPQKPTASEHVQIMSSSHSGDQPIHVLMPDSYQKQVKDDSAHTSDTTDHSEARIETSLTDSSPRKPIIHNSNVSVGSPDNTDFCDQTLTLPDSSQHDAPYSREISTLVPTQNVQSTSTAYMATVLSTQTNEPHQIMLRYNDKLVMALSADPLGIAGILLAKGLIPENTAAQMQLCSTPHEKACTLVTVIRQRVGVAPKRFQDFIEVLSEQTWTKDIVEVLQPFVSTEHTINKESDISMHISRVHVRDQKPLNPEGTENLSSSEQSSSSEENVFPTLNSDDEAELEAQLIMSAESMKKKFAALLWNIIDSFKSQCIDTQSLVTGILALTEYEDSSVGKPLLEHEKDSLMKAKTVDQIFHILRPHMTFFNYETLEFLVDRKGSKEDKRCIQKYLREFKHFCKRSVFEIPQTLLHHSPEKALKQQILHVKITKQFKAALLIDSKEQSESLSCEKVSAPELGISLECAKHIQRKIASVLKLTVSSLYLDSVKTGSTILTFLLPSHISLAGLDSDPDIIALSSNGIHILCGPPGKPMVKELTPNGLIMRWSSPEYGCNNLAKYTLCYQKKNELETSEWQKNELTSLETHTCISDLSDGCIYVFKICTVSDVGTLQYSDESDPSVISANRILTNNIHKVIVANKDTLTSAFASADPNTIAVMLSIKGVISKEDEAQISLASTPSEKATLLITAVENQVKSTPQKFQHFLNALSEAKLSLHDDIVETLWSDYYDSVYKQYLDYLKFLYASLDKKQTSSDQWPPSATKKFFRLAMIQTATVQRRYIDDRFVQMTITGKVDDILRQKYPIQLEDIFKETEHQREVTKENEGQRKVILFEGAPGCGKSTLSVYICQQWEKGQLFNQFQLVILIQLRDPAVKNAKGLTDLLPCPDTTIAQQIASRMLANKCQDVLFILDGWDELPSNLRKMSIFHQLVQRKMRQSNRFSKSTVIVSSRPIASGDLHQFVSSRVEILGFTAEELHQFFTECLKGDTKAVKTLLERIEENPEVAGSCYLPLNATILVHLFKSDRNTLPTTLYGIFSSLVLNCIKRHLKLRTQYKDASIESLDQLPEFAKKPFSVLCRLAYDGVMEDKIIFTSLPADVNTLSLLQGVESFIGQEKLVSHNFIHLSIQELLAAWYIATQLPANEQVSKFNELFDKSRFSAVFRFYAAITKLKTPGIKDVVVNVVKTCNSKIQHYSLSIQRESQALMASILNCLYEAQDPSLCESVAQQLQHRLDLSTTTLTLSDCLCIGYFLAHVCKMAAGEFEVNLRSCSIGDQGCKYLVSGLHKYLDTHSAVTTLLSMHMNSNAISHHGVHHLSTLLKIGYINSLDLTNNDLVSKQDAIRGTLAKQLKSNTTLKHLRLEGCGLNSQSAESLAEALTTNKHLELLSVSDNALCDDGIQHLAYALRVNQGLKVLYLDSCGMTDVGLDCLAKSLQHNNVLTRLYVYNGYSTNNGNRPTEKIVPVLTECLQNNHTLNWLELPQNLKSSTASIEKAVNDVRKTNGLPLIKVSGMSVPTRFHSNTLHTMVEGLAYVDPLLKLEYVH